MELKKLDRVLDIFYRIVKGESVSVRILADAYGVSTKTINRDINTIKMFLSEHRELMNNAELVYNTKQKSYVLNSEDFLLNKELFALVKVIIGCRCFSKEDLLTIIEKLKKFTTQSDREMFKDTINKEVFHYHETQSNHDGLIDDLWKVIHCIDQKKVISIRYTKMDLSEVKRKIKPVSIMFSEYYFYLIAYNYDDSNYKPIYFRIDRISSITEHRETFTLAPQYDFNEGDLREKNQYMFPGQDVMIKFQFTGLSIQAILDRLPTAKVVERKGRGNYIVEAKVNYGRGIIMYLLSQGAWVRVLSPQSLIDDMTKELNAMKRLYE
jgi:predicted DNA-binding transcriptional regulator YafY